MGTGTPPTTVFTRHLRLVPSPAGDHLQATPFCLRSMHSSMCRSLFALCIHVLLLWGILETQAGHCFACQQPPLHHACGPAAHHALNNPGESACGPSRPPSGQAGGRTEDGGAAGAPASGCSVPARLSHTVIRGSCQDGPVRGGQVVPAHCILTAVSWFTGGR